MLGRKCTWLVRTEDCIATAKQYAFAASFERLTVNGGDSAQHIYQLCKSETSLAWTFRRKLCWMRKSVPKRRRLPEFDRPKLVF